MAHARQRLKDFWGATPAVIELAAVDWALPCVAFVGDERTAGQAWTTSVALSLGAAHVDLARPGASNDWMAALALRVLELHRPALVVQWTDPTRYWYVDDKQQYRDFVKEQPIPRDRLSFMNPAEEARQTFYAIETRGMALHRLMMHTTLLHELGRTAGTRVVQIFSWLDGSWLDFLRPRVDGVVEPIAGRDPALLSEWVLERLRC
jgi:hypothetical protein